MARRSSEFSSLNERLKRGKAEPKTIASLGRHTDKNAAPWSRAPAGKVAGDLAGGGSPWSPTIHFHLLTP